jgi:hypothetical protein
LKLPILNDAYANTGVSFNLIETDITRNSNWYPISDLDSAQDDIYSASILDGILGYATFRSSYTECLSNDGVGGVVIFIGSLPGGGHFST